MLRYFLSLILISVLCGSGCSPINEPPPTSQPEGPANEWAGDYEGICLLTCDDVGAFEREMQTTLRLTQVGEELNVQLFLTTTLAYSPRFRITAPVYSDNIITFHIFSDDAFMFHADLHRSGDYVGGALWVTDINDHRFWEAFCIEVDR